MKNDRKGLMRILFAAKYSMNGFAAAFRSEAAFRQDCLLCAVLFSAAWIPDVSGGERCALIMPLFVLLIAELLNSAVEKCVDISSPEFSSLAKFAKDAGSAAVFAALANIAVCWAAVLLF